MSQIICIKIAQRLIEYPDESSKSPYQYFPYDRVYLVPKNLAPLLNRMFRYHLQMPLDRDLFQALIHLNAKHLTHTTVERDDIKKIGEEIMGAACLKGMVTNFIDWILAVPTHVQTKYNGDHQKKTAFASGLRYILSTAVQPNHNTNTKLPPIKLITPNKTIELLCGACAKLPDFYSGECTPGHYTCRRNAKIHLRLDQTHKRSKQDAIKETTGDET